MSKEFDYIDLSYLEEITDGDADMKKEILTLVVEEVDQDLPKLQQFYQANNLEDLHTVSHKFKSTLAFVGNDRLTEANLEVEKITKYKEDLDQLPSYLETIQEIQPLVLKELTTAFEAL